VSKTYVFLGRCAGGDDPPKVSKGENFAVVGGDQQHHEELRELTKSVSKRANDEQPNSARDMNQIVRQEAKRVLGIHLPAPEDN
jgi:hypothetical protein